MKQIWSKQYAPHITAVLILFLIYEVFIHTKVLDFLVGGLR